MSETQELVGDSELCVPESFEDFILEPFSGIDSCLPLLADAAPCVCVDKGSGVTFAIANKIHDLFSTDLELELSYIFLHESANSVSIVDSNSPTPIDFDTDNAEGIEGSTGHLIQWEISYRPRDYFVCSVGSVHLVAGSNMFKENRFFIDFVAHY